MTAFEVCYDDNYRSRFVQCLVEFGEAEMVFRGWWLIGGYQIVVHGGSIRFYSRVKFL